MFEAYFGFTASPFRLGPDPRFYFESSGHGRALTYLKYGVHQREGFIVVTGEIGSGKTTLIRKLLEELDPREIAAAQVVSTQLDSHELLRAVCTAFGVPVPGPSKALLLATLEAFFAALAVGGRRALLIVDEAQNLGVREAEEMRMLSNFHAGGEALLQSFLVGQPELRRTLQSSSMEQLRQRVIASCHLGALTAAETRPYVEHRLRHVGWRGHPAFDDDAFAVIYRRSGGIPRRINLLCTRALMACWLGEGRLISAADANAAADELATEVGEAAVSHSDKDRTS
jgi:putative secretion ATPase (PEP-CTERM system associated)